MKGILLSRRFYEEAARPVLERHFPGLRHTAALLGYGSDVLGYDDAVSTDHMWGPRFYLFLGPRDMARHTEIMERFEQELPESFCGYNVSFSAPDPNDNGVRHPEPARDGRVSPLIFIHTIDGYLRQYLGVSQLDSLSAADWLSFSEHRLLALSSASIFHDDLGLAGKLEPLRFYPEAVRRYLLASNWSLIAEEQAFVRRCADVGDEAGSILICARITERLMRLYFLYRGQYAPYSKWFGTAFLRLAGDEALKESILSALTARTIDEREERLVRAQSLMAQYHNAQGLTEPVDASVRDYFGRKIKVIFADRIAESLRRSLTDPVLGRCPLIGTLSGVANFTVLSDPPKYREHVKNLYEGY